jgi:hypothetical protein
VVQIGSEPLLIVGKNSLPALVADYQGVNLEIE